MRAISSQAFQSLCSQFAVARNCCVPLLPNMPEHRLLPLMQRFAEMLVSSGLFGRFLSAACEGTDEPESFYLFGQDRDYQTYG